MIEPTGEDIGRQVAYLNGHASGQGVVTSFNEHVVFVLYRGDIASKATRREHLFWIGAPLRKAAAA